MSDPRILIVDDLDEQRTLLRELLADHGRYHVREACDGRQGVEAALAEPPDIVLMDVDMPSLNGIEACRRLKADPRTHLVPVIIVTGLHARDARLAGLKAGCDDFLNKPVDPEELIARVTSALRLKNAIDQLEDAEAVLFSLARALDAKDPYTAGHSERVSVLAERLGRASGVPDDQIKHLRRAALLHDVGKIGTPRTVLNKPGRLTTEEFEVIQLHPVVGEMICQPLRTLGPALWLIRHHHERPDGRGYPDGIDASAMDVSLHCLIVADVYDALTSARPYRGALAANVAIDLMRAEAQVGAWDTGTVELLVRVLDGEA